MRGYSIVLPETGGPEVFQVVEGDAPKLQPNEVLIETYAAGLNFIETYQRSGVYKTELPAVLGSEGSGKVVAKGAAVKTLEIGDEVITAAGKGTYAQYFLAEEDKVAKIPAGIDPVNAAAIPLQGITAHYLATSSSNPKAGESVLVHAGAGGVGLILTQILTAKGVNVITTASTPEKRALSLEAGAKESVAYENFAEEVARFTNGEGVSVVYDGVGRDTFDDSLDSLKVRGLMVLFGGASGQVPPFDLQRLNSGGSLTITRPSAAHFQLTAEEVAWRYSELFDLVESGALNFRVGTTFPLNRVGEAHEALESRVTTGKTLLIP